MTKEIAGNEITKQDIIKILQVDAVYDYPLAANRYGKTIDSIKLVDKNKAADLILELFNSLTQ